jgi:uncharacterized protein
VSVARLRARVLPDGRRLHLSDGPIDLVIQAWGTAEAIRAAYAAATARTTTILDELCAELALLRRGAGAAMPFARGEVARRMQQAVLAHAPHGFITPMAAVAGAVAEAVLAAMTDAAVLDRAYVNNGGDIALQLAAGHVLSVGLVDRPDRPSLFATALIQTHDAIRGIATSGWRGRSFSLGIADAVTVLAGAASEADAAATVIANAVDLPDHIAITRVAARAIDPQSDLGERLVTRAVVPLLPAERETALASGAAVARRLAAEGKIHSAALHLQGASLVEGLALLATHAAA